MKNNKYSRTRTNKNLMRAFPGIYSCCSMQGICSAWQTLNNKFEIWQNLGECINNAETQGNKTAQNRSGNSQKPHRSSDRQHDMWGGSCNWRKNQSGYRIPQFKLSVRGRRNTSYQGAGCRQIWFENRPSLSYYLS